MTEEQTAPLNPAEVPLSQLPGVPESFLKKRKKVYENQHERAKNTLKHLQAKHYRQKVAFKRAEKFIKENRVKARDSTRLQRQAQHEKKTSVPADAKLAFAVRLHGGKQVSPQVTKVLTLLRLTRPHHGVFLKLNKATLNLLRIVEPYVTWGYPNLKSVRDLIYKRGFAKVDGKRVPLTNNETIESQLGKANIICTEDLIHEISSVGPNFGYAARFLWPFKLDSPTGGWNKRTTHFSQGGEYGNREDQINELLRRMI